MSIKVGDKAPDFTLVTKGPEGPQLVKLSELIGSSNLVLLFVPMAFTGVCTTEFCDISAGIKEYEALDAKVLGNVRTERLHAIAFTGMVPTGQVGHAAFTRVVRLWLGNFAGNERIGPSCNGRLEITLRTARAPGEVFDDPGAAADQSDRPTQHLAHMP